MKKYHTWYDSRIEEVEAVSETTAFVTVKEGDWEPSRAVKHPNNNTGQHYHDTWQEARQFLIDREKQAIIDLLNKVKAHQETLQKIEAMQCPQ